ncbi:MAG TPA: GNAT family protein [Kiloniellaceae bacterium]|nr:GNAT family protein [Kiloniellaceae bacterium]
MRPFEKADVPTVTHWFFDLDDLALFDRFMRIPLNREAAEKSWAESLAYDGRSKNYWFTITRDQDIPIGIIGIESISAVNSDAVVPVFIDRAMRHKGVGIRAFGLVLDIAFRQLNLARITSYYRADNEVSRTMTGRLGFSEEGRLRQAWFSGGKRYDMIAIGLLREEWLERRKTLTEELDLDTVVTIGRDTLGRWSWPLAASGGEGGSERSSRPEPNEPA